MPKHDGPLADSLGPGSGDEVLLHRLAHALAGQAGDLAGKVRAQRDRRQDHVPRPPPKPNREHRPLDAKQHD